LTGGIATGKSYVRARFEELGVPTIDSDVLAREVVAPGTAGLAAVIREFGREVLDASGALDRRRLAAVVFADASRREALEATPGSTRSVLTRLSRSPTSRCCTKPDERRTSTW
jgi:dephospho-CoA kinase